MDSEVSAMSRAIDLGNLSTHGPDEENLFVPVDVTREAKGYEKWINDHIWHLNRMQKQPDEVVIAPIALLTKAVTPLQQVYNRHRR